MNWEKSQTLQVTLKKNANVSAAQNNAADKKPAKKKMGLAMLFLGILAEES